MMPDAMHLRRALANPVELCERLGLSKGARRQSSGLLVCCPAHEERTPSCSVTIGADGTIRAKCFGCDWSGDALGLIAKVYGHTPSMFGETLRLAANLAGEHYVPSEPPPKVETAPPPEYPARSEVLALWDAALPVCSEPDAWEWVCGRGMDAKRLDRVGVARGLPLSAKTPAWARYGRGNWVETGHRLLVLMFDHAGSVRSVRAVRIEDPRDAEFPELAEHDDPAFVSYEEIRARQAARQPVPKRLPPKGCRADGLVMCNRAAVRMLRRRVKPSRLLVCEGEPDFLLRCTLNDSDAVIGIVNGSWPSDSPFADAVPAGIDVHILTHADQAGERYAEAIAFRLKNKCKLWRN